MSWPPQPPPVPRPPNSARGGPSPGLGRSAGQRQAGGSLSARTEHGSRRQHVRRDDDLQALLDHCDSVSRTWEHPDLDRHTDTVASDEALAKLRARACLDGPIPAKVSVLLPQAAPLEQAEAQAPLSAEGAVLNEALLDAQSALAEAKLRLASLANAQASRAAHETPLQVASAQVVEAAVSDAKLQLAGLEPPHEQQPVEPRNEQQRVDCASFSADELRQVEPPHQQQPVNCGSPSAVQKLDHIQQQKLSEDSRLEEESRQLQQEEQEQEERLRLYRELREELEAQQHQQHQLLQQQLPLQPRPPAQPKSNGVAECRTPRTTPKNDRRPSKGSSAAECSTPRTTASSDRRPGSKNDARSVYSKSLVDTVPTPAAPRASGRSKSVPARKALDAPCVGRRWHVVGGVGKGGIIVRESRDLNSRELADRLSTGALVVEEERVGDRLRYSRLTGAGPAIGWVTVRLSDKELLVPCDDEVDTKPRQQDTNRSSRCVPEGRRCLSARGERSAVEPLPQLHTPRSAPPARMTEKEDLRLPPLPKARCQQT